jgi:FMN-dependent NADH-azoreductase
MKTVLRIDSSASTKTSISRALTDRIVARFEDADVITRDLSQPLPQIDETWVTARAKAPADRTEAEASALALSDTLVEELKAADTIVIGVPVYNFGIPASLKAWIDLVARAGVTFAYTADGPKGLLEGKRAILAVASGGTEVGSGWDFATGYMRHVLGFIGITDVEIVAADRLALGAEDSVKAANDAIDALKIAA